MGQGAEAALWEAGLHFERMTGTEACVASVVTGQRLAWVGPETDPQGSPEGAWSEGVACVRGQAAVGVAWEAWARDVNWVMTEVGPEGQGAEPESWANEEREAFEGGGMLLTG